MQNQTTQKADILVSEVVVGNKINGKFARTFIVLPNNTATSFTVSAPEKGRDGVEIAIVNTKPTGAAATDNQISVTFKKGNGTTSAAQNIAAQTEQRYRWIAGLGTWVVRAGGSGSLL